MRIDGRGAVDLRPIKIERNILKHADGSVFIKAGDTHVICAVSVEDKVPPFLRGSGQGWLTAEYSMLPRATEQRTQREATRGKVSGRTMEIQRLIGRALRAVIDLRGFGERTLWVDCDVIQADGGTRTASITGSFVAVVDAFSKLKGKGTVSALPVKDYLAAISVGIVKQELLLDLKYEEDSSADVDMNVVMTGKGEFVEVQGTGENGTFSRDAMGKMMDLAEFGIRKVFQLQKEALQGLGDEIRTL